MKILAVHSALARQHGAHRRRLGSLRWRRSGDALRARHARAAGEAPGATLNEQLNPSALLTALPAAKAALVALMQNTRSVAAAISIVNLIAGLPSPRASRHFSLARTRIRPQVPAI